MVPFVDLFEYPAQQVFVPGPRYVKTPYGYITQQDYDRLVAEQERREYLMALQLERERELERRRYEEKVRRQRELQLREEYLRRQAEAEARERYLIEVERERRRQYEIERQRQRALEEQRRRELARQYAIEQQRQKELARQRAIEQERQNELARQREREEQLRTPQFAVHPAFRLLSALFDQNDYDEDVDDAPATDNGSEYSEPEDDEMEVEKDDLAVDDSNTGAKSSASADLGTEETATANSPHSEPATSAEPAEAVDTIETPSASDDSWESVDEDTSRKPLEDNQLAEKQLHDIENKIGEAVEVYERLHASDVSDDEAGKGKTAKALASRIKILQKVELELESLYTELDGIVVSKSAIKTKKLKRELTKKSVTYADRVDDLIRALESKRLAVLKGVNHASDTESSSSEAESDSSDEHILETPKTETTEAEISRLQPRAEPEVDSSVESKEAPKSSDLKRSNTRIRRVTIESVADDSDF